MTRIAACSFYPESRYEVVYIVSIPLNVDKFSDQIEELTSVANTTKLLWTHLAPAGVPKSTGNLVTLELYGCKIVIEQVDIGYLHNTIRHIADDLATIACEIDILIKIRNIKKGTVWSEAERRLFIAGIGTYHTGPWNMPYRTLISRVESIMRSIKLNMLTRRYKYLRRKYPNR